MSFEDVDQLPHGYVMDDEGEILHVMDRDEAVSLLAQVLYSMGWDVQ